MCPGKGLFCAAKKKKDRKTRNPSLAPVREKSLTSCTGFMYSIIHIE